MTGVLRRNATNVPRVESCGAPGEIRTPDLLVRSQTLYPTELRAQTVTVRHGHAARRPPPF